MKYLILFLSLFLYSINGQATLAYKLTNNYNFASVILPISQITNTLGIFALDENDNLSKISLHNSIAVVADSALLIDKGRLKLPIDNKGVIADVNLESGSGGRYDDHVVLFSAGFYLTGYANGELWGNGVLSASRIEDYLPGKVNSSSEDPKFTIYHLNESSPDFGNSWQQWKDAVDLGANFYDGDKDGIYNPIDKNNNAKWDEDEDRPDLIGQETYWYIINDGVPKDLRRYDVDPLGIEIKTTLFTSGNGVSDAFDNTIFIRYEIENSGLVADKLEDVYFSFAQDPDIGNYENDLVGTSINTSSGFSYDEGIDGDFGSNSPSVFMSLLEGPVYYWKGKSYEDINGNDFYDEGIDTLLDTAFVRNGNILGESKFPGALNNNLHSTTQYMSSHPTHGDPDTHFELRYYQMGGKSKIGDSLFTSSWPFGNGALLGADSTLFPSKFMYWGDPETQTGWLNTFKLDQRIIVSTGPFDLEVGKTKTVLGALIVARGTSSTNSVTLAKEYWNEIKFSYDNNFINIPVSVENEINNSPKQFSLSQNYPNPFNPSARIRYSIPNDSFVSLKIYDLLGKEVKILVDQYQKAGAYEVHFLATHLASGIYVYQLISGNNIESKKMMLIK